MMETKLKLSTTEKGRSDALAELANPLAEFCCPAGRSLKAIAEEPGVLAGFKTNRFVTIDGKQFNFRWLPPGSNNVEVFYLPKKLICIVQKATHENRRQAGIDALKSVDLPDGITAVDLVDGILGHGKYDYAAFKYQRQNNQPVVFVPFPPADRVERLAWSSMLVHEITHARGFEEPIAFREQYEFLSRNGVAVDKIEKSRNIAADGSVLRELKRLGYNDVRLFWGLNEIAAERCRIENTQSLSAESATTIYRAITDNLFRDQDALLPMALALLTRRSQTGALNELFANEERPAVCAALVDMESFSLTQTWRSLAEKLDIEAQKVIARKA